MGIRREVYDFGSQIEGTLKERFDAIDKVAEYNQLKVVHGYAEHVKSMPAVSNTPADTVMTIRDVTHWKKCTQRFSIQKVLWYDHRSPAELMHWHWHWLQICARAMSFYLQSENLMTHWKKSLESAHRMVLLQEYGITYRQVDLLEDGAFDYDNIRKAINEKTKLVTIQRSKGYQTRPSFSVAQIGELIAFVKSIKPDVICMVDNCYGEFVETIEPTDVGADMVVGSLIKNPGGGLAPIGGYIAGKKEM